MTNISFPLNEVQMSLLRLTENLPEQDLRALKKIIIAFKAQRLAQLADKVWEENAWNEATMQQFLYTHLRTPYISAQQVPKK